MIGNVSESERSNLLMESAPDRTVPQGTGD